MGWGGAVMPCAVPGEGGFKGGCYGGDGNYVDDGQNYRGLLIPVSVTFIPVKRAGLLRRVEGGAIKHGALPQLPCLLYFCIFPVVLLPFAYVMPLL